MQLCDKTLKFHLAQRNLVGRIDNHDKNLKMDGILGNGETIQYNISSPRSASFHATRPKKPLFCPFSLLILFDLSVPN